MGAAGFPGFVQEKAVTDLRHLRRLKEMELVPTERRLSGTTEERIQVARADADGFELV